MPAFPESILITGGAGFVGGNLAVFLKRRHPSTRVIAMDNLHRPGSELNLPRLREAGVEFVKGDIRSAGQFPARPFEAIIERMSGRRSHPPSGRTYHVTFNPPKVAGVDDVTGEPLVQRADDQEETVKKRLEVYSAQTRPLVAYYSNWATAEPAAAPKYRAISGTGSVDDITTRAFAALAS